MRKFIFFVIVVLGSGSLYFIDLLSFIFKATNPELSNASWTTTKLFLYVIICLFWVGLAQLYFKWKRISIFARSIPSHMTSLGILGTFLGIFIGLYKFDVNNLHISVPLLLDGMKLAFGTSIAGLACSTLLKVSGSIITSINANINDIDIQEGDNINISDTTLAMLMAMDKEEFEERLNRLKNIKKEYDDIMTIIEKLDRKAKYYNKQ